MPDGELLDVQGVPTTLAQVRAGRPAVVVFYRGAWCPYCNLALRTYQAELVPALAARGVELIAVSPQKPDGSLTMAETNKLTFSVVSDPGNQLASALGILSGPEPGALSTQWSTRRQGRSTSKIGVGAAARYPQLSRQFGVTLCGGRCGIRHAFVRLCGGSAVRKRAARNGFGVVR